MSWSTSELRVRLAPLNRFKPSSKIFYWPFQGGTSFVDLLCYCSVLCLLCLCARLFICALWSPAGKGLTSWLSFVVSTVSLSLSHWYLGLGVVLDCIDSWSLHPYLLRRKFMDKLVVLCKSNISVSCSTLELRAMVLWNLFKPCSKNSFPDRSKAVLLLWIIFVIYASCLSCFLVCSLQPRGHLLGNG